MIVRCCGQDETLQLTLADAVIASESRQLWARLVELWPSAGTGASRVTTKVPSQCRHVPHGTTLRYTFSSIHPPHAPTPTGVQDRTNERRPLKSFPSPCSHLASNFRQHSLHTCRFPPPRDGDLITSILPSANDLTMRYQLLLAAIYTC